MSALPYLTPANPSRNNGLFATVTFLFGERFATHIVTGNVKPSDHRQLVTYEHGEREAGLRWYTASSGASLGTRAGVILSGIPALGDQRESVDVRASM